MKINFNLSCTPKFGMKIPSEVKDIILWKTKKNYKTNDVSKLLKEIAKIGTNQLTLGDLRFSFSECSPGNIFGDIFIINPNGSSITHACLGQYDRCKLPIAKIKTLLCKNI